MADRTKIEWCDMTFNPWIGCTRVGPGCDHCYAADLSRARLGVEWGPGKPRRRTAASTWKQPRAWDRRAAKLGIRYRVFCASLADVFDNEVPVEWRIELFQLIRETPNLDWLLVTKRIGNADRMAMAAGGWPASVWLGATVVNQVEADRDVPKLLAINGPRFRFLSMEPLLGPVSLEEAWHGENALDSECWGDCGWCEKGYPPLWNCQRDWSGARYEPGVRQRSGLDWVIVGGESGPGARPIHPDWARSLRDQCAEAGVPFTFKQWGEWAPTYGRGDSPTHWLHPEGGVIPVTELCTVAAPGGRRYGKKAAGRLLDGVQHDGVPA